MAGLHPLSLSFCGEGDRVCVRANCASCQSHTATRWHLLCPRQIAPYMTPPKEKFTWWWIKVPDNEHVSQWRERVDCRTQERKRERGGREICATRVTSKIRA